MNAMCYANSHNCRQPEVEMVWHSMVYGIWYMVYGIPVAPRLLIIKRSCSLNAWREKQMHARKFLKSIYPPCLWERVHSAIDLLMSANVIEW